MSDQENVIETTNMRTERYKTFGFKCGKEAFNELSPIPEMEELDLGNGRVLKIVNWNPKGTPNDCTEFPDSFGELRVELTGIITLKKKEKE